MPLLDQFNLLQNSFFSNIVLPFVLIFTVVFAILERTKVVSDKRDVHAIIALVLGLLAVGVPAAVGVLQNLIPLISVLIIILFSWFLVFGFVGDRLLDKKGKPLWSDTLKRLFSIILGVVILGLVTWSLGLFNLTTGLDPDKTSQFVQIGILVGVIIAVIAVVVSSAESHPSEKEKEKDE